MGDIKGYLQKEPIYFCQLLIAIVVKSITLLTVKQMWRQYDIHFDFKIWIFDRVILLWLRYPNLEKLLKVKVAYC